MEIKAKKNVGGKKGDNMAGLGKTIFRHKMVKNVKKRPAT